MRREGTLVELLAHWAQERPDKPVLIVGNDVRTFAELNRDARTMAAALAARGIVSGDRVAIMATTSIDSVTAMFGATLAGAVIVPMNVFLKGDPLVHQVLTSGSRVVVTDPDGLAVLAPLVDRLPLLETLVVVDADGETAATGLPTQRLRDLLSEHAPIPAPAVPERGQAYGIIFTSGTTGMPKGCVISHGLTEHWSRYTERLCALDDDDVIFTAAPLFHIGGQTPLLAAVACGVTVVLETRFSASGYLPRAKQTGATVAIGVGWIAQALLKQPAGPQDRDHRLRAMSTVQLSVQEQKAFLDRFGVRTLTQQYGQTECYPISYNVFDEQTISPYTGKPTPELIVGILDAEGRELGPGEVGEISIRPREPFVMFEGYWDNAEATAQAFAGLWYHTGDLGRLVDGEVQYVDRKKDSMRRRGENVSAFELERALLKFPSVAQAAVHAVTLPDEIDDSIKACIVVKPDEPFVLADLATHLHGELPYFAVPQFIEVFEELPTNAAGRVMKDALRKRGISEGTLDLTALGLGVTRASRRAAAPTS